MEQQDFAYWQDRAAREMQLAQAAGTIDVARPHYRIAIQYMNKAEELSRRSRGGASR